MRNNRQVIPARPRYTGSVRFNPFLAMTIAISSAESLGGAADGARRRKRAVHGGRLPVSDDNLVNRFNSGEITVFDEIVARHRERIYNVAFGLLHNHADTEEIVQDTFVRAYHALPLFRGESSLATWLYRIATNLARNRYWYFFRRRRHATISLEAAPLPDSEATFADILPSDAPGPVRQAEIGEFGPLVDRCMSRLNTYQREILTRRNILHQSYGAIARALGVELGTVKSRIARARESLRLELSAECPEFSRESPPTDWFEPPDTRSRLGRANRGGEPR